MTLDDYQDRALAYDAGGRTQEAKVVHVVGLGEEAGEVLGKFKKSWRDGNPIDVVALSKELGDALWYITAIADDYGLKLSGIAQDNIAKLQDRTDRGTMHGEGDNR